MILFQLRCSGGHQFEAWFKDGATYDEQSASGVIECPFCGDHHVGKAPMAPSLGKGTEKQELAEVRAREVAQQILRAVDKLRNDVMENSDYVGDEFADEARRIHYGETEQHDIFGEATDEETDELDEEGIEYFRFPSSPRRDD